MNFESQDDYKKFRDEIKQAGEFEEGVIGRKSVIPDPEMIIAISHFVLGGGFTIDNPNAIASCCCNKVSNKHV